MLHLQDHSLGSSVDPEGPGEDAMVQESGDKQESDDIPVEPPPKRLRSSVTCNPSLFS